MLCGCKQARPVRGVDLRHGVAVERVEEVELRSHHHLAESEVTRHGEVHLVDAIEEYRARLVEWRHVDGRLRQARRNRSPDRILNGEILPDVACVTRALHTWQVL